MKIHWSRMFRSEKARVKPVLLEDVNVAEMPDKLLEREHEILSLRFFANAYRAAELSGRLRERITEQVALQVQGRNR